MSFNIKGDNKVTKLAIVTGGSKGIGLEIVKRLAQEMEVLCISRSGFDTRENPTHHTVHNIEGDDGDLSNPQSALDAFSAWLDVHADYQVSYLIHNAAVLELGKTVDLDLEAYNRAMNINVLSPFGITKLIHAKGRFSAQMTGATEKSSVTYVTSSAAREGTVLEAMGLYSMTKAALNQLASIQKKELASTGIKVHRVYPGIVKTGMQTTLRTDPILADDFKDGIGSIPALEKGDWNGTEAPGNDNRRLVNAAMSARFVVFTARRSRTEADAGMPDELDFYTDHEFHRAGYNDTDYIFQKAVDGAGTHSPGAAASEPASLEM